MKRGLTKEAKHTKAYLAKVKENGGVGPTSHFTPTNIAKMEEVFAMGGTNEEAAFVAGVTIHTLYNYFKDYPEFKERCQQLKQLPVLKARRTVVESLDKDIQSAWRYLEKRDPDFAQKQQVTHTYEVKELSPVQAEIIKDADERLLREGISE